MINGRQARDWLRATPGRLATIVILSLGAFFLPQDLPLVWCPLPPPAEDVLYLQVTCAVDKPAVVVIGYSATRDLNSPETIRWPMAPGARSFTYQFPLPDGPICGFTMAPVAGGGSLAISRMSVVDRSGRPWVRFTRSDFSAVREIAAIKPTSSGWEIDSTADSTRPQVAIQLRHPLAPTGMNHRNLLRCALSVSYLALMLAIVFAAVVAAFSSGLPGRTLGYRLGHAFFLAFAFAIVGNRGLIRQSVQAARFEMPPVAPGFCLEMDVANFSPDTAAQLFWDLGAGFSEAQSVRCAYETHTGVQTLRFPLPASRLKALRFDPENGPGTLEVKEIRVVNRAGRTLAVLAATTLRPIQQIDRLEPDAGGLRIVANASARDPILFFSDAALESLNRAISDPRALPARAPRPTPPTQAGP